MIKFLSKSLVFLLSIFILIIFYLSVFGVNTKTFNDKIKRKVLTVNKKIKLELNVVNLLLNPIKLTIKIKAQNPKIFIDENYLKFNYIKTDISLKSLIKDEFSLSNLNISTKTIKLNDLVSFTRTFKKSAQLFILENIIKEGSLIGDINLNFDSTGKLKDDYQINGTIKDAKLSVLRKYKLEQLDLFFKIQKDRYLLNKLETDFNKVKLSSPKIEIVKKNNIFTIKGKILSKEKNFDTKELSLVLKNKDLDIENINLNTSNDFSFNINNKFKIDNLNIQSMVNLRNLDFRNDTLDLKKYLPDLNDKIQLNDHKILINYHKDELKIKGNGLFSIGNKADTLKYDFISKKSEHNFNITTTLENNTLQLDSLNYKKAKGLISILNINGIYKKNKNILFDTISLKDNNKNIFLIKGLDLNNKFKIVKIDKLNLNYTNRNNIKNKITFFKDKNNYTILGEIFDATILIDSILNNNEDNESSFIFSNLNSNLDINIDKTYLDKDTYINSLKGKINYNNNKIDKLDLNSFFPNGKKLTLTINTNSTNEKITTLFSDYPKPLVNQYKFIKGFEEGVLDFSSIKKGGISKSVLKIDNFKVQEVPILAKLLTLASLQGIADLLTGEGIRFTDFEMKFSNKKKLMKIEEMYAIGPAISILMEGYIESKKVVSLRGTLVPATTINRTISSIPLIGKILVGKKTGEGVFGVSFNIKGSPEKLKTSVNPIKTLTPRFITRTLEKIRKN
jgi:hypothetical protein